MIKLDIKDEIYLDFILLGLNTVIEDYRLVFLINKILPFQLTKSLNPDNIKNKNKIDFEFYKFENEAEEVFWYIIPNQKKVKSQNVSLFLNLFEDTIEELEYFIPEFKKMDYIIKITDTNINTNEFTKKLKEIKNISSVSIIDLKKIKQKNHLIF